eukprot:1826937-Amphidinium_carterae.1
MHVVRSYDSQRNGLLRKKCQADEERARQGQFFCYDVGFTHRRRRDTEMQAEKFRGQQPLTMLA